MKKQLLIVSVLISGVLAHAGAEGVVADRMDAMKAIGKANRPLAAIARGRSDFDLATVQASAKTIAEHAGQSFVDMFPEGSMSDVSEAKADIWEDFGRFSEYSMTLESTAMALSQIQSEDEFKAAFDAMSKNCGGCHRPFREKKN